MGAEGSKSGGSNKPIVSSSKKSSMNEKDLTFFANHSRLQKAEVQEIFDRFNLNNPDGKLDKNEFVRLYRDIRPETPQNIEAISSYVFKCFDTDHNGFISFNEFLMAYALTTKGDLDRKLEYAFDMYDLDGNGFIETTELRTVLNGMLEMLGADKKNHNVSALANQCMSELNTGRNGRISKEEFIKGLLANYSLRALMSPFN